MTLTRRSLLALSFVAVATPLAAQSEAATEFIIRKGKDTVSVERYTRDAATLSGNIAQSNGAKFEYVANLRPDNSVDHVEMQRTAPNGQGATLSIDFGDTLVTATLTPSAAGAQPQNFSVATLAKPLPFLLLSFAMCEQIVKASRADVGKPVKWMAVRLGAGDTASMTVTRLSPDSVTISVPQGDIRLAVSASGSVLGGSFAPAQWVVERKERAKP